MWYSGDASVIFCPMVMFRRCVITYWNNSILSLWHRCVIMTRVIFRRCVIKSMYSGNAWFATCRWCAFCMFLNSQKFGHVSFDKSPASTNRNESLTHPRHRFDASPASFWRISGIVLTHLRLRRTVMSHWRISGFVLTHLRHRFDASPASFWRISGFFWRISGFQILLKVAKKNTFPLRKLRFRVQNWDAFFAPIKASWKSPENHLKITWKPANIHLRYTLGFS